MTSCLSRPVIGPNTSVELARAAAGCVTRVTDAPAGIPEGWPKTLPVPMAWAGAQFKDESEYIHTLSESDIQEVENALQVFKGTFLQPPLRWRRRVAYTKQRWDSMVTASPETTSPFLL